MIENIPTAFLRNPPNMLLIVFGYVLLSLLMTYFYPRIVNPSKFTFLASIRFGMLMGVVWLAPYSLVLHGAYHFPVLALVIDTGWALIEQGLGGIVIGFVYGRVQGENN